MRMDERIAGAGVALAVVAVLALPARTVLAHEGHEHKAMGTVEAVDEAQIRVKTQGGDTVAFVLTPATAYKAGKAEAQRGDVKVGGRVVVVFVEEDGQKQAKEVLLPAAGEEDHGHSHGAAARSPGGTPWETPDVMPARPSTASGPGTTTGRPTSTT